MTSGPKTDLKPLLYNFDAFGWIPTIRGALSLDLYYTPGTPSDYTTHVHLHRVFKTAMNFVKFLFHKNYHHEREHDTFLPASNLHPFRRKGDFSKVFKHQIDSFLRPIMKLRRLGETGFDRINIDPIGILNYSKSFVYACRNNGLISDEKASQQLEYITLLEDDTNNTLRHNTSLLNSIASQGSILFLITNVLAFMVAVLTIFNQTTPLLKDNENLSPKFDSWLYPTLILIALAICGGLIVLYSQWRASKKEFHDNHIHNFFTNLKARIFFKDSDLDRRIISGRLSRYIRLQDKFRARTARSHRANLNRLQSGDSLSFIRNELICKLILWLSVCVGLIYYVFRHILPS